VALLLFVLPGLVTLGGALAARGTMYPRFFFFLAGFALLIVARGIAVLSQALTALFTRAASPVLPRLAGASLVGILIACSLVSLRGNYRYPKQDFEGAMACIDAERGEGEPVVTAGVPATFCYHLYYNRSWPEVGSVSQLAEVRASGRPVWLVYAFPRYLEQADAGLAAEIREQFTVSREFFGTVNGGAVIVCRASPRPSGGVKP
jgi:hypothetical protein